MSCGSLCCSEVGLADLDDPVSSAATCMRQRDVGSLVILDAARKPIGILTDRDLVIRVLALGLDPAKTLVCEVMTRNPNLSRRKRFIFPSVNWNIGSILPSISR